MGKHRQGKRLSDTKLLITLQAIITLSLLFFAWVMREADTTISNVVVSATVYHWLRESSQIGRSVAATDAIRATSNGSTTHQ